eukprot:TRINITY_DN2565_c0_g1_i1.p1 TRINITY_DN2565_c0_g1~~TRINITY_DN2565_c0_g1_i1.p1  ORF type:complete len:627 (+),score=291.48 TRINITY_DN2565_c0_g1_i1:44-1924(+)
MGACCSSDQPSNKPGTKPDPKDIKTGNETTVKEKEENQQEIAHEAKKYPISYDTNVKDIAMLGSLPPLREAPKLEWIKMVLGVVVEILKGDIKADIKQLLQDLEDHISGKKTMAHEKVLDTVCNLLKGVFKGGDSMEHAKNFEQLEILLTGLDQPETLHELDNDYAFTRLRLSGFAPMQLRKLAEGSDKDNLWSTLNLATYSGVDDTLLERTEAAYKSGRLYAVNYSVFKGQPAGTDKVIVYPTALFELPEDQELGKRAGLVVLCVQVNTGDVGTTFTPKDETWSWRYAKLMFNMAESNFHEGIVHLADTHLVVEAICLSMHHSLADDHPVYVLLNQHFTGTVFINWAANVFLIDKGGAVDELLTPTIDAVNTLVSKAVLSSLDSDLSLPARLQAAGLDEAAFPCGYYPFRDDASLIWDATLKWVTAYIDAYYPDDESIGTDRQLQSFRDAMVDYGKIGWVKRDWDRGHGTKAFVSKLLASFIFIGSTQHCAVNFTQKSLMLPTNDVPLGNYAPVAKPGECTEEQTMLALPPIERAKTAKDVLYLLGGVHFTVLGEYEANTFQDKVLPAAEQFKKDLEAVAGLMDKRNKERVAAWDGHADEVPTDLTPHWAYTTILPKYIPQSINI